MKVLLGPQDAATVIIAAKSIIATYQVPVL